MSRPRRKSGDDAYNARRRYYRSAQRNLKKAEKATGANAARYKALAKQNLEDALNTYDPSAPKQRISKPIQDLAKKFGIDIESRRSEFIASTEKQRKKAVQGSVNVLEGALSDEEVRKERESRALLNNPKIGRRIIGGFVDVWREAATDYDTGKVDTSEILPALLDYFQVETLSEMLEKVEQILGDKLYADEDSDAMYEAVKILIQTKIADNTMTA